MLRFLGASALTATSPPTAVALARGGGVADGVMITGELTALTALLLLLALLVVVEGNALLGASLLIVLFTPSALLFLSALASTFVTTFALEVLSGDPALTKNTLFFLILGAEEVLSEGLPPPLTPPPPPPLLLLLLLLLLIPEVFPPEIPLLLLAIPLPLVLPLLVVAFGSLALRTGGSTSRINTTGSKSSDKK
jgi:hypothetical protein